MSSNYWQTKKLSKQFRHGNTVTSKIESYVRTWEARCYSDGIPDEVPAKIAASNRAPSYKAIAMCLLRNDFALKGIGFEGTYTDYYRQLKEEKKRAETQQGALFNV